MTTLEHSPWSDHVRVQPVIRLLAAVAVIASLLAVAAPSGAGLTPPTTDVVTPARRATLSGDVTVTGTAQHAVGIASVRLVIKDLDEKLYWNGSWWQTEFIRLDVPAVKVGEKNATWSFTLGGEHFSTGRYRARAFAYSVEGNGDPFGGDTHGFRYDDSAEPAARAAVTPTPDADPAAPVVPPEQEQAQPPPTTAAPATTVPPTTAPPTTAPPTTAPPTTTAAPPVPAPASQPAPANTGDCGALLVPCQGVLLGASGDYADSNGNWESPASHFREREQQLGANFDIYHEFRQWNDLVSGQWPKPAVRDLANDGRTLFVNWKSPNGNPDDWAGIANGSRDNEIRSAAQAVASFGQPMFLTFFHEPEDNIKRAAGNDAAKAQRLVDDYRAAFRHIVEVFDANGAHNVAWVWDVQGYVDGYRPYYENGLYPGDDVVDWVGYNPYNWHGCDNHGDRRKWESFSETISDFYAWLNEGGPGRPSQDKPIMLGEFGTEENDRASNSSQSKADWIAEVGDVVPTQFPRLKALVYFDTEGKRSDGGVTFCRWGLSSSNEAMDSMSALLTDPRLAN